MRTTGLRKLAIGGLCAAMMAGAGVASAQRWHHIGGGGHWVHSGPGISFGLGFGIPIAPAYPAPVYGGYYGPDYYDPGYVGPSVGADIVIGGGWGGGYSHGGGGYSHGGGGYSHGGGGYSHGGGGYSHGGGRR